MGSSPGPVKPCAGYSQTLGMCHYRKLGADLEQLLDNSSHSDFVITVQGREFALHRAILAVRSKFFRDYLHTARDEEARESMDLGKVVNLEGVGCEAFMSVMKYIYGGRMRASGGVVMCMDDTCAHVACWPAVNYSLDFLRTASVFEIQELRNFAEEHMLTVVDTVPVEYLLTILVIAKTHDVVKLQNACLETLAKATWNYLSLEKLLPIELVSEIRRLKIEHGHTMPSPAEEKFDKQARRVQRALDSDDVELVQLLLSEGHVKFDDVHGLHYAVAYCDEKTVRELLDLQLSNPNAVNYRGLTVLHIACMRREPEILAGLLAKGARANEETPDGRTAFQIVKRLTKVGDVSEDESQRAKLCLEILEQAGPDFSHSTFSKSYQEIMGTPATNEKELVQQLLYLENRIALAKWLFPREAQIVTSLAHVESTHEYMGLDSSSSQGPNSPSSPSLSPSFSSLSPSLSSPSAFYAREGAYRQGSVGDAVTGVDANLRSRVNALEQAVKLGHRFFPRCSRILNEYMDDELPTCADLKGPPEEHVSKKQRFLELKDILAEAFTKDVADMDQHQAFKKLPSSLSSSSSCSLGGSPMTMRRPMFKDRLNEF